MKEKLNKLVSANQLPEKVKLDLAVHFFEFEQFRRRLLRWRNIFIITTITLLSGAFLLISNMAFFGIVMTLAAFAGIAIYLTIADFRNRSKELFFEKFILQLYPQLNYEPFSGITSNQLKNWDLMAKYSSHGYHISKGEDLISGPIGTLDVCLSETAINSSEATFSDLMLSLGGDKGIMMIISSKNKKLSSNFVEQSSAMQQELERMETFWKTPIRVFSINSFTLLIFIPTKKKFLELPMTKHLIHSGILEDSYLQLTHLLDFVRLLDLELKK